MTKAKVRLGKLTDAFTCLPETLEDGWLEVSAYTFTEAEDVGVKFLLTYEKAEELAKDILARVDKRREKKAKLQAIVVNAPPVCRKCLRCHRGACRKASERR